MTWLVILMQVHHMKMEAVTTALVEQVVRLDLDWNWNWWPLMMVQACLPWQG